MILSSTNAELCNPCPYPIFYVQPPHKRVLVCDGAMGTMLYARGIFLNRSFDDLNLTQPDLVAEVHQAYAHAGADVLETNTFGANRIKLATFGLAHRVQRDQRAGRRSPGVAARPDAWALCSALVDEAVAVAALEGIELDAAGIVAKAAGLAETSRGTGGGKPSMLLDVEARRPTEVAVINGAVVAAAERHGADAPLHRAALALIGGIEASWRV